MSYPRDTERDSHSDVEKTGEPSESDPRPRSTLGLPCIKVLTTAHVADFDDPNIDKTAAVAGLLEDDSPYPEVRSAVANMDNPEIPCSTFRAWVLGLAWAILIPVRHFTRLHLAKSG